MNLSVGVQLMQTIGIDIGGTKIAGALVDRSGEIRDRIQCPTRASEGAEAVMSRVIDLAASLRQASGGKIEGIGVASGGQIDPVTGVVIHATDLLPGWKGTRITEMIETRFRVRARALNDGSAAALGEGRFGAARDVRDFVLLTLGTGVGGGIVAGGKLVSGALGVAGSIGHMVIDCDGRPCNCGSRGCLEAYVSGTAILGRMIELADERGYDSQFIRRLRQGEPRSSTLMHDAVRDRLGNEVVREAGDYLGWGFVSLLNLLNPAMIVVGGGVAILGEALLDPAREIARKHALRGEWDPVRIVRAELGNNAGLVGAASLVWEEHRSAEGKESRNAL